MAPWYLVISIKKGYGVAMATIPFSSEDLCTAALSQVLQKWDGLVTGSHAICLATGL